MRDPNYADSPKDRAEKGRSPADPQLWRQLGRQTAPMLKLQKRSAVCHPSASCSSAPPRPSCGPGEGGRAFASVVTAQQGKFMSKSFKARWLGRGAQGVALLAQ